MLRPYSIKTSSDVLSELNQRVMDYAKLIGFMDIMLKNIVMTATESQEEIEPNHNIQSSLQQIVSLANKAINATAQFK